MRRTTRRGRSVGAVLVAAVVALTVLAGCAGSSSPQADDAPASADATDRTATTDPADPTTDGTGDPGPASAVEQVAGRCALLDNGTVQCWGPNGQGRGFLGTGTTDAQSLVPVSVHGVDGVGLLTGVDRLFEGVGYCAVLDDTSVACWAAQDSGVRGDQFGVPTRVTGIGGSGTLSGVTDLVSAEQAWCALLDDGTVACWGQDLDGQLGTGGTSSDSQAGVPSLVVGVGGTGTLDEVTQVVVDGDSRNGSLVCALRQTGTVVCWGDNSADGLGHGPDVGESSNVPVEVAGIGGTGTLDGVAALTSGFEATCARLKAGSAVCWGSDTVGQLGDASRCPAGPCSSAVPVVVQDVGGGGVLSGITEIDGAPTSSYCAVLASGSAACWGQGSSGQLGNSQITGDRRRSGVPVAVDGVGGSDPQQHVTQIVNSGTSRCALLKSSGVVCWGRSSEGQLGNGATVGPSECLTSAAARVPCALSPVPVSGIDGQGRLDGVTRLFSDDTGFCALVGDDQLVCWGSNDRGSLGNGTDGDSAVPVVVQLSLDH